MAKTIKEWEASRIAARVSSKAFEHLLVPLKATLDSTARAAYDKELAACGITEDVQTKLRLRKMQFEYVNVFFGNNKDKVQLHSDKQEFVFSYVTLIDKHSIAAVQTAYAAYRTAHAKCDNMARDLRDRLHGKSATSVIKTWPEIEGFVREELKMDMNSDSSLTPVPFALLIAKHLPALPAPAKPAMVKRR